MEFTFFIKNFVVIASLIATLCSSENNPAFDNIFSFNNCFCVNNASSPTDSVKIENEFDSPTETFPSIKYHKLYMARAKDLAQLRSKYNFSNDSSYEHIVLTTLNRKEFRFIKVGDSVLVPDDIYSDIRFYSVFPEYYHDAEKIKKIILVSNKYQCYACYEYGKLVRFAAANTGKEKTPTYPGRYSLVWRAKVRKSSLDETWIMPYTWNFHLQAGNAFHQFTMPGRPVSHSCVRQFMRDAKWLFSWGEGCKKDTNGWKQMTGTPVIILDIYDFARKKYGAWIDLTSNKDFKIKPPKDPMNYEEALIPISQIPKDSRGSLRNRERFEHAEDTLRARGVIRKGVTLSESRNFNLERKRRNAERLRKKQEDQAKKNFQQNIPDINNIFK